MEHTDPNNDNLLKHLKIELDAFRSPAPSEIWDGIAHDLDLDTDTIDSQLKSSLQSFSQSAPAFIWSNIESDIGNNEIEDKDQRSDMLLDKKLQEAANAKLSAPETIWYGIEQQLNVDAIWNGMQPKLNKLRSAYIRKRIVKFISVAALLLLFIRTCSFDTFITKPISVSIPENNQKFSEFNKIKNTPGIDKTLKTEETTVPYLSDNVLMQNNEAKVKEVKFNKKDLEIVSDNVNLQSEKSFFIVNNEVQNAELIINNLASEISLPKDDNNAILFSMVELSVKNAEQLAVKKLVFPEIDIKDHKLNKKNSFIPKYELGLVSVVNSAILINDQNTKKLSHVIRDKVETVPNLSYNFALQVGVQFAEKHSFLAEFWYNSKIRQEYRYNINGKQQHQTVDLNYVKFNLLYRPILFSYGFEKRNAIVSGMGLYLANLKHISNNMSANALVFPTATANEWDTGFSLSIGQEHKIGKSLVLDYGLRNEIGFSSIFKTNKSNPDKTSHLGLGAYLALRYRF
jgi:hypothetical protein